MLPIASPGAWSVSDGKPEDMATMTFPIAERSNTTRVEKELYTLLWKGMT